MILVVCQNTRESDRWFYKRGNCVDLREGLPHLGRRPSEGVPEYGSQLFLNSRGDEKIHNTSTGKCQDSLRGSAKDNCRDIDIRVDDNPDHP